MLGLVLALFIPLICFFYVLKTGGDGHVKLPKFYGNFIGLDTVTVRGKQKVDSIWQQVKNITLTNQLNQPVNICNDLPGKIVLINFFFSTCTTVCPKLNGNLKFLITKYKKADSLLHFVSLSVDEVNDDIPQLRQYANSLRINHDKWWFCNGKGIKQFMVNELHMPDVTNKDTLLTSINHSNLWVLIDKERNIRGYYDAIDTNEIRRCADDISLLILEKKRKSNLVKQNKLDQPLK